MAARPVPLDLPGRCGGLRVWDYGGDGPPLLLCHCAGTCGRIWEPVITRLQHPFRALALDFRGHGDSAKPEDRHCYRWEGFAEDVLDAAEALRLGPEAFAAGHSGGGVAVTLARMARPDLFGGIALVDAILAPSWFFPEASPLAAGARRRKHAFASRAEARQRLHHKYPHDLWHGEAFEAYLDHGFDALPGGGVALKCPGRIEALFYEAGSTEGILNRLDTLALPLLLVTGANSYMREHVAGQHRLAPEGSRMEVLPDTGHFPPQEQPDAVARLFDGWFGA